MAHRGSWILVAALVAAGSASVRGDVLLHIRDGMYDGQIRPVENDPSQVEINIYWSKHKLAKFGTVDVAKELVKRQLVQKRPQEDYHDRALALKADDAAGHAALANWCKKTKRKHEAIYQAQLALIAAPDSAEIAAAVKKILSSAKAKKFLKQHTAYTEQTLPILRELLKIDPKAEDRDDQIQAIKDRLKGLEGAPSDLAVDRIYRSNQARRGLFKVHSKGSGIDDSGPLQMRMDVGGLKRCGYALFVPKDYDPLQSYPLILGLHGGGPGPNPDDDPVGSGSSTISFYIPDATTRKYIIVCPDAIRAGWGASPNGEFIDKLLREMVLTYNVDLRRVYVMGHSMGGYGTWAHGPRLCESIAAFSPNSGASGNGFGKLVKTHTAVYMYHGHPDPRCPFEAARAAAKGMKKQGVDFIYTELDGTGHSWPRECISQSFDLFDRRRTYACGAKMVFAHPSTRGFKLPPGIAPVESLHVLPLSKPELTDLGGIVTGKHKKKGPSWKDVVTKLTKGGELGDEAAAEIKDHPEKARMFKAVVGLLHHENEDTRRSAATALGNIGDPKGLKPLGEAATEKMRPVRRAAVHAIQAIGGPDSLPVLKGVLRWQADWFDGVTGGDRTRADNWEHNRDAIQALCDAFQGVADAETMELYRTLVVEGMILRELDIAFDPVAHSKPEVTRRRYIEIVAKFVGDAGVAEGRAVLDALARCTAVDSTARRDKAIAAARAKLK